MNFTILTVQTSTETWLREFEDLYLTKLSRYCKADIVNLKSKKISREDPIAKKEEDAKTILNSLAKSDYVILLDENGKSQDSMAFSKNIQKIFLNFGSYKRVVFIIGGPYGSTDELKARAQQQISLSALTFNHLLAKAVLLEQLYRSLTIIKGIPYHNE